MGVDDESQKQKVQAKLVVRAPAELLQSPSPTRVPAIPVQISVPKPSPRELHQTVQAAKSAMKQPMQTEPSMKPSDLTTRVKEARRTVNALLIEAAKTRDASPKDQQLLQNANALNIIHESLVQFDIYLKDPQKHRTELESLIKRKEYKELCQKHHVDAQKSLFSPSGNLTDNARKLLLDLVNGQEIVARGFMWESKSKELMSDAIKGNPEAVKQIEGYLLAGARVQYGMASQLRALVNVSEKDAEGNEHLLFPKETDRKRMEVLAKIYESMGDALNHTANHFSHDDFILAKGELSSVLDLLPDTAKQFSKLYRTGLENMVAVIEKEDHPVQYYAKAIEPWFDVALGAVMAISALTGPETSMGEFMAAQAAKKAAIRYAMKMVKSSALHTAGQTYFAGKSVSTGVEASIVEGVFSRDALISFAMAGAIGSSALSSALKAGGLQTAARVSNWGSLALSAPAMGAMVIDTASLSVEAVRYGLTPSEMKSLMTNVAFGMVMAGSVTGSVIESRRVKVSSTPPAVVAVKPVEVSKPVEAPKPAETLKPVEAPKITISLESGTITAPNPVLLFDSASGIGKHLLDPKSPIVRALESTASDGNMTPELFRQIIATVRNPKFKPTAAQEVLLNAFSNYPLNKNISPKVWASQVAESYFKAGGTAAEADALLDGLLSSTKQAEMFLSQSMKEGSSIHAIRESVMAIDLFGSKSGRLRPTIEAREAFYSEMLNVALDPSMPGSKRSVAVLAQALDPMLVERVSDRNYIPKTAEEVIAQSLLRYRGEAGADLANNVLVNLKRMNASGEETAAALDKLRLSLRAVTNSIIIDLPDIIDRRTSKMVEGKLVKQRGINVIGELGFKGADADIIREGMLKSERADKFQLKIPEDQPLPKGMMITAGRHFRHEALRPMNIWRTLTYVLSGELEKLYPEQAKRFEEIRGL